METTKGLSIVQMTKIAFMIAFVSASSYIRIPLPFSGAVITGQTLAVNVAALVLSPKEIGFTMGCYWLLGLVGVPVFGGMAGPGMIFGPTGGYVAAFVPAAICISFLKGKNYNRIRYGVVTLCIGIPMINGIGTVWLKLITGITWKMAFLTGFMPYIFLDVIKCLLAVGLAKHIQRIFTLFNS